MDISETYIKMRLKAIPYLGLGERPDLIPNTKTCWISPLVFIDSKGDFYFSVDDKDCQLERQDQLQEMVKSDNVEHLIYLFVYNTHQFGDIEAQLNEEFKVFTSMEQLWLAFVMKEKYNKTWNGENWL